MTTHRFTVVFSKKFDSGNLAGITVDNQMVTFPTRALAEGWLEAALADPHGRDCGTGAAFTYVCGEVVAP